MTVSYCASNGTVNVDPCPPAKPGGLRGAATRTLRVDRRPLGKSDFRGRKLEPDPHGSIVGSSGKCRPRPRRFLARTALPTNGSPRSREAARWVPRRITLCGQYWIRPGALRPDSHPCRGEGVAPTIGRHRKLKIFRARLFNNSQTSAPGPPPRTCYLEIE